jgi:hypothetical protein
MTELFQGTIDTIDPEKDYTPDLVGEGKKYKTVQDLARAVLHKDVHITRIEGENSQVREELATRISYQDFLDQIKSNQGNSQDPQDSGDTTEKSAIKPEDVADLVLQKLNQTQQQQTASQNEALVVNKLTEVLGPNYASKLRQQAAELGLSDAEVKSLAQRNPKALFRMFGIDADRQVETFEAPVRTQQSGFAPTGQKRGKTYYDEIYKSDPNRYFSPEIYNERYKLIQEIGI